MARTRKRNWVFTINYGEAETAEDVEQLSIDFEETNTQFLAYQLENAGTFHHQGLIIFKNGRGMPSVKRILGGRAHLEVMQGTLEQAYEYATKEETRVAGPWEHGTKPDFQPGKRNDLETIRDAIMSGVPLDEIYLEYPSTSVRAMKWIQKIHAIYLKRSSRDLYTKREPKMVHVLWGTPGSGKTSRVYMEHPIDQIYKLTFGDGSANSLWFDDYQGEDVLLIDDFYGNIRYSYMLRLLDIYPLRVQCKGSYTYTKFTKIYITSNCPPEEWYSPGTIPDASALLRRITRVEEVEGPVLPLTSVPSANPEVDEIDED